MVNKSRRKKWEEMNEKYKSYMKNLDEIWDDNYNKLVLFLDKYKKTQQYVL